MTGKEARQLTDEQVGAEIESLRSRLVTLRTQSVTEKVDDNSQFRKVRKDIARLLTERRARELGGTKR